MDRALYEQLAPHFEAARVAAVVASIAARPARGAAAPGEEVARHLCYRRPAGSSFTVRERNDGHH
jgi:hypothetical protein